MTHSPGHLLFQKQGFPVRVEKYYRDAMFIAAVTGNYSAEREKLSTLIFESRAGWI